MGHEKIQVLLVEDNPGDARLMKVFLAESSANFEVTHTFRLSEAKEYLAHERPDAVLLDLGLPDSQGLATLRATRKAAPGVPAVVLTGLNDEELAVQALKEGAQDYLCKGTIASNLLIQSLRYAIERQRLQAETEQVRLQQIALKDEFLSHVSHELRSPLNAIYQFVSILSDGLAGECNPQQREYLQIITRNLAELQSMIGELLDVTRAGAGKLSVDLQLTSVSQGVEDAMNTVKGAAEAKGVCLTADVPSNLPRAYADPSRLRQVLVNLLGNAIKFTPAKGKVSLKAWAVPGESEMLQFAIADTGSGISPEFCERIFERLYQVAGTNGGRQGLGLGLYICRELVAKQGGRIWVDNSSKDGSTFCFTLPVLSLPTLLAPILSQESGASRSLALIKVELWSPGGWTTEGTRETLAQEARYALGRCVLAELDVVLPKVEVAGDSEFVFLAARADVKGAEVIVRRIKGQLQRNEAERREQAEWCVDVRMIPFADGAEKWPKEELSKKMANIVQNELEEWTRVPRGDKL